MPTYYVEIEISEPSFLTFRDMVIASNYEEAKIECIQILLDMYKDTYGETIEYKDVTIELFNIAVRTQDLRELYSSYNRVSATILAAELSKSYINAGKMNTLINIILENEIDLNYIIDYGILTERELFPEIDRRKKLAKKTYL